MHRAERSGGDDYDELLRLDEDVPKRGLSLAAIRALVPGQGYAASKQINIVPRNSRFCNTISEDA